MDWFCLTCYRCRSEFLHPDRGPAYCMHCAAPPIGIRGDGQLVRHEARPAAPPPETAARPAPRQPGAAVQQVPSSLDENGELRIYHWSLISATTGKRYTTRRKFSEVTAKGMDPNAQPVGHPEIIHATGETNTSICMGRTPSTAQADATVAPTPAGPLPGWRDGRQHQWSRDPGRGRRYR
jgi:hypothetical protein